MGGGKTSCGILTNTSPTLATTHYGAPSVCFPIEGNGARESHRGSGWAGRDDPMFTLNGVEKHAVAAIAVDVYNQEITGEIAASITAASGGTNTSGPKVIERCEIQ